MTLGQSVSNKIQDGHLGGGKWSPAVSRNSGSRAEATAASVTTTRSYRSFRKEEQSRLGGTYPTFAANIGSALESCQRSPSLPHNKWDKPEVVPPFLDERWRWE